MQRLLIGVLGLLFLFPSTAVAGLVSDGLLGVSPGDPVGDLRICDSININQDHDAQVSPLLGDDCRVAGGGTWIDENSLRATNGQIYRYHCQDVGASQRACDYVSVIAINGQSNQENQSLVGNGNGQGSVSLPSDGGLVPIACYDQQTCGTCEFVELINNVIRFIILFASIAATLMIIYGGFQLVVSAGNVSAREEAKKIVTNVLIGYVLVLTSFLIVNTILGVLLPGNSPVLGWQKIQCLYPTESVRSEQNEVDTAFIPDGFIYGDIDALIARGEYTPTLGGGGSCSVPTSGACAPANMGCFSNPSDAARVCNLESSGGNYQAVSGSDLCADGRSFSGGLWQINVLANHSKIPGCSGDFFVKNGSSAQGNCLRRRTNSKGVSYCAVRDCRITNVSMYNYCMGETLKPEVNTRVACQLYGNGGWNHWLTSARACSVQTGL